MRTPDTERRTSTIRPGCKLLRFSEGRWIWTGKQRQDHLGQTIIEVRQGSTRIEEYLNNMMHRRNCHQTCVRYPLPWRRGGHNLPRRK